MYIDSTLVRVFMIFLMFLGGVFLLILACSLAAIVFEVGVEKLKLFEGFRNEFIDYRQNKKDYKVWRNKNGK